MGDWLGLLFFVLVLAGGLFGLTRLSAPPPMSQEEFERRVQEGRGWMSAGAMAGMHALQKLMNPKAAEAVAVEKDLKSGYYNDQQQQGDGPADAPEEVADEQTREEDDDA